VTVLIFADGIGDEKQKKAVVKKQEIVELTVGFSDYVPKLR